jgi:predicted Zn-dependent protease
LSDLDIKSVMADLDYHSRDYRARGITEFQEILAKQPENVVANRGLGYEAMQKNDWDKAAEHFKRAAAQDVKDPQVHYLLALMMSRKGRSSGNKDNLDGIRKELAAAIALEPNYPDAYNLLGMTLSYGGEKKDAIDILQKAVALSPRNPWFKGNLASAYLQAQDLDHAIPLLQELQSSNEPGIASMAAQQLHQVEAYRSAVNKDAAQSLSAGTPGQPIALNALPDEAGNSPDSSPDRTEVHTLPPSNDPVLFMKGVLVSVDCSATPAATLTISSGGKKWKMLAPQSKKLILIGADEFSCSWTNRKVSANYRRSGPDQGNLVSLEFE